MARNLPDFCKPILVSELVLPSVDHHLYHRHHPEERISVRVFGRLTSHDLSSCRVTLADPLASTATLGVDTMLVEPLHCHIGSLVQCFGELEVLGQANRITDGSNLVLRARILKSVDGLDPVMYEKALLCQRNHLKEHQSEMSGT